MAIAHIRALKSDGLSHPRKIRVLIADDHELVREGLVNLLDLHSDIEVVGEASDGEEAIRISRELNPDVVLMDISMPKMDGIEATKIIHKELPHIRIIALSMHDADVHANQMVKHGAFAYCSKIGSADNLIATIKEASTMGNTHS